MDEEEIDKLKMSELKQELKKLGLSQTGKKEILRVRLKSEMKKKITGRKRKSKVIELTSSEETSEGEVEIIQPKKKRKKKSKKKKEKRTFRFRSSCPKHLEERINRSKNQRMFLVERRPISKYNEVFSVLGSTGNIYKVEIDSSPSCDCPDFNRRQDICKHLSFVMLKVLKIKESKGYHYQRGLLKEELKDIFLTMPKTKSSSAVMASEKVRKKYDELTKGIKYEEEEDKDKIRKKIEGDCPICFESMHEGKKEKIEFCEVCGNNIHKICWDQWKKRNNTCVYCRSECKHGKASVTSKEGYTNLAEFQNGVTSEREPYDPDSWRWSHGFRGYWY